jgi:hypothetical protein
MTTAMHPARPLPAPDLLERCLIGITADQFGFRREQAIPFRGSMEFGPMPARCPRQDVYWSR